MEEDIKILEEMITWDCLLPNKRQTEALENLIKGYRELEKENKLLKKVDSIVENIHTEKVILKIEDDETIPKSKIKEKIEELEKEFDFYAGREHTEWQDGEFDGDVCDDIALKIQVLKELMEDK